MYRVVLIARRDLPQAVLADCFQHQEPGIRMPSYRLHQTLVNKPADRIDHGVV